MESVYYLTDMEGVKHPLPLIGTPLKKQETRGISREGVEFFRALLEGSYINLFEYQTPVELLKIQSIYLYSLFFNEGDEAQKNLRVHFLDTVDVVNSIQLFKVLMGSEGDVEKAYDLYTEKYCDNVSFRLFKRVYEEKVHVESQEKELQLWQGDVVEMRKDVIDPIAVVMESDGVGILDNEGILHKLIPYVAATNCALFLRLILLENKFWKVPLNLNTENARILVELLYRCYKGTAYYENPDKGALLEALDVLIVEPGANYQVDNFRKEYMGPE